MQHKSTMALRSRNTHGPNVIALFCFSFLNTLNSRQLGVPNVPWCCHILFPVPQFQRVHFVPGTALSHQEGTAKAGLVGLPRVIASSRVCETSLDHRFEGFGTLTFSKNLLTIRYPDIYTGPRHRCRKACGFFLGSVTTSTSRKHSGVSAWQYI